MQIRYGSQADFGGISEKGTVEALCVSDPQATSAVARDDRDGCSRYRASEMSCDSRIIRVVPRAILAPMDRGGVYFLYPHYLFFGGQTNEPETLWRK